MTRILPVFRVDERSLNLFVRKCEHLINRFSGPEEQDIYVFNIITSRLTGDAAALLSEHDDITNWSSLKDFLKQYFGDPCSEERIIIELEN